MTLRSLRFGIRGMTCAACSARVERALKKLEGVDSVAVNLTTEKAAVRFDADLVGPEAVLQRVEKTGYEPVTARAHLRSPAPALGEEPGVLSVRELVVTYLPEQLSRDQLARRARAQGSALEEEPAAPPSAEQQRRRDFQVSLVLSLVLMGSMTFGHLHWLQFLLATAMLLGPGRGFFSHGFQALAQRAPDMNTLVMLGTGAAWSYSTYQAFWGHGALYFEASAMVVTLVLLGKNLEERAKGKAREALEKLLGLQNVRTALLVEPEREVALEDLIPGDRLRILPGQTVPVDAVVESGTSAVDESMLTGEPVPVERGPGDKVVAGSLNGNGSLLVRAEAVGADTVLAQIVRMVEEAQAQKPPIQDLVDRVVIWFVPVVLSVALLTFALWYAQGGAEAAVLHAVAVLVIACPCAMGLATPTSLLVGTTRGAELGILFRSGAALQQLQEAQLFAFDKTGTLTEGKPILQEVRTADGFVAEDVLRRAAAVEKSSEHPLARSVVAACREEIPAAEQFLATPGQGAEATVEGHRVRVGSLRFLGEPVPGFPAADGTSVWVEVDGVLAAQLSFEDPLKEPAQQAVRELREQGLRLALISGDRRQAAEKVAAELGIDEVLAEVLPGEKAEAVARLQAEGRVAFVGDGLNDGPALARADVGVALRSGTDLAVQSADVVLMASDLLAIPRALRLSRQVMRNIRQNLFWAFAYNVALIPVAAGLLPGVQLSPVLAGGAMACSSFLVVSNALRLRYFHPER